MRALRWSLILLLLIALPALAGLPVYYVEVAASQTNSTVTVVLPATNNIAYTVTLANDGLQDVYVTLNSPTAATTDLKVLPGEIHRFNSGGGEFGIRTLGIICATGESSTVRVFAYPTK